MNNHVLSSGGVGGKRASPASHSRSCLIPILPIGMISSWLPSLPSSSGLLATADTALLYHDLCFFATPEYISCVSWLPWVVDPVALSTSGSRCDPFVRDFEKRERKEEGKVLLNRGRRIGRLAESMPMLASTLSHIPALTIVSTSCQHCLGDAHRYSGALHDTSVSLSSTIKGIRTMLPTIALYSKSA